MIKASIGHVLPPSLDEADAGEVASKGEMLSISWQALNHDEELMDDSLNPHVVILSDALQLANRPGKLVEAIQVIKRRFLVHYCGLQELEAQIIVRFCHGLV